LADTSAKSFSPHHLDPLNPLNRMRYPAGPYRIQPVEGEIQLSLKEITNNNS
jgi:hypothetical protein